MVRLCGILGMTLAITVGLHVYASGAWDNLYTLGCYLVFDALYLGLALQLVFLSFCLLRTQATAWRAIAGRGVLVVGSLAFILATVDIYIIALCCDTSGLGGIQC